MKMEKYNFRVEISFSNGHVRTLFVHRLSDVENIARKTAKQASTSLFQAEIKPQTSFARHLLKGNSLVMDSNYYYNFFRKGERVLLFA